MSSVCFFSKSIATVSSPRPHVQCSHHSLWILGGFLFLEVFRDSMRLWLVGCSVFTLPRCSLTVLDTRLNFLSSMRKLWLLSIKIDSTHFSSFSSVVCSLETLTLSRSSDILFTCWDVFLCMTTYICKCSFLSSIGSLTYECQRRNASVWGFYFHTCNCWWALHCQF